MKTLPLLIGLLLLGSTLITDEGLKHLSALTKLEHLNLGGTRISERKRAIRRVTEA